MTHAFPTRRSSDLKYQTSAAATPARMRAQPTGLDSKANAAMIPRLRMGASLATKLRTIGRKPISFEPNHKKMPPPKRRSEEQTSELQSLMRISYAVFCLKKKKTANK